MCGKTITGPAVVVGSDSYHPQHLVCAHCEQTVSGRFTTYKNKNYHDNCFANNVALRCALCSGIIQGEYILDYWGNGYHKRHKGVTNTCEYCARFISDELTGGGVRYSDGRHICGICRKDAITDVALAKEIMLEVAEHLEQSGIRIDTNRITLHLTGLKNMQELLGRGSHSLMGFTDYFEKRLAFGFKTSRKIDIYILYGIPKIDLVSTLAHEMMHVWQFVRGRLKNDKAFSEGSCNYAAYLVLRHYDASERGYIIHNMLQDEDPLYGEGFRRVKRYVSAEGTKTWLDRLQKKHELPNNY